MGQAASRQEAFWEACGFGHVKRVERFIEDGIDVNWVSYTHDCCPIHVASQGKPEIVRLLLQQDCNVNVLDIRGNTPIHHAAMRGHDEIIQTLITAGCKIDNEDKNGWTALHNAAYWCHYKAVKVLLKSRCDTSIVNKDSRSALHEVARSKEKEEITLGEIARLLIEAGSDIDARGSDLGEADFTGLMFASYHGHLDVASAFIEAGCDVNATGASNNWSALHWAADRGKDEVVYLLLGAGIDPTIKAYRGQTAADRAKSPEIKETILNAINMFEELKALDVKCPPTTKTPSRNTPTVSPTKNKVTNQMVDNIFNRMPPIKRPDAPLAQSETTAGRLTTNNAELNETESPVKRDQFTPKEKTAIKVTELTSSSSREVPKPEVENSTNEASDKIDSKADSANHMKEQTESNADLKAAELSNQATDKIDSMADAANQKRDETEAIADLKTTELTNDMTLKTESVSNSANEMEEQTESEIDSANKNIDDINIDNSQSDISTNNLVDETESLTIRATKPESID